MRGGGPTAAATAAGRHGRGGRSRAGGDGAGGRGGTGTQLKQDLWAPAEHGDVLHVERLQCATSAPQHCLQRHLCMGNLWCLARICCLVLDDDCIAKAVFAIFPCAALLEASVPPEHIPLTSDHMPLTSARSHAVNFRPQAVNFRPSPE